jgi:hypothetical protein
MYFVGVGTDGTEDNGGSVVVLCEECPTEEPIAFVDHHPSAGVNVDGGACAWNEVSESFDASAEFVVNHVERGLLRPFLRTVEWAQVDPQH